MMAAYEVLLLNTAIPQIQAAQSGDTYVVPRDIAFSAALTLSAGTANGVPYLNGSKVLTTGSALTFDGTNLSSTGGATFQGGPTGYGGGEVRLGTAASGQTSAISTLAVDSPVLFFDHRGSGNTGVFAWRNGTGSSNELMRLTSTGLGIGTSSPGYRVDASGQVRASEGGTGSGDGGLIGATSAQNGNAGVLFQTNSASRWNLTTFGTNGANLRFYNYALASTVATLDSSGDFLVGKTNSGSSGVGSVVFGSGTFQSTMAGTSTNFHAIFANNSGTTVGSITSSGSTTAYNTSSDYRLKENVEPMQGALATIAQLKPVTYTWKSDGSAGQGFIAHELQAVVPDAVTGEKDAVDADGKPQYQGVDTSFLVATLVKAIQELTARVAALEAN
jgi:hypothetical protein